MKNEVDGWRYYNHAAIPSTPPHLNVNMEPINSGHIWNIEKALLARWTTDWDCKEETNWWYVIKDTPLDISILKSKRRYEINKGNKNFDVIKINALECSKELYDVTIQAYQSWPERYRPNITFAEFEKNIYKWQGKIVYGAYHREENCLCGYAMLSPYEDYIDFNLLRVIPKYEKMAINAALVYEILMDNEAFISTGAIFAMAVEV